MTLNPFALSGQPQIAKSADPIVRWTGKSGLVYETQLHPLMAPLRDLPGVYIVCKVGTGSGFWKALYVGKANQFNCRIGACWKDHEKRPRAEALGATHICTLIVYGTDAQRFALETDLRQGLNPPLNDQ
jgi:excinuclease UvrABC nuclease subunit